MTTRAAILEEILRHPDDDSVRLVYADWLDDHPTPATEGRAEFIRLQVDLARLPPGSRERFPAERRQAELLAAHQEKWLQELPPWVRKEPCVFRRGFVAHVHTTANRFLSQGEALFASTPLEGVRLRRVERDLASLADAPLLPKLRSLDLTRNVLRLAGLLRFSASPGASHLTELVLDENYIDALSVCTLLESGNFPRLERLSLRRTLMSTLSVFNLAQSASAAQLRALKLNDNRCDDRGVEALANSPHLTNLTDLDLGYTQITPAGLTALAESPLISRLSRLDLGSNFTNLPGAAVILSGARHRLSELRLDYTNAADAGAVALADSPSSASLTSLSLYCCRVTDVGAGALVRSPHLANLTRLELGHNWLSPDTKALLRERFGEGATV